MKKKSKKILLAVIALVLVAAIGVGIFFAIGSKAEPVGVYPFTMIGMDGYWGDTQESHGPVSTDKIQTVFLSDTQTVTEILVAQGDTVKKGDVLMTFDTTLSDLQVERKRLEVEKLKLQLSEAEAELRRIRNMVPMEPMEDIPMDGGTAAGPVLTEPYEFYIEEGYDGGTPDTAFICWIRDDTVLDLDSFLEEMRQAFRGNLKLPYDPYEVCVHGVEAATCDICRPELCRHLEIKALCKVCTPPVCIHDEKGQCVVCHPELMPAVEENLCEHGNDPDACTTCNPKCEHGNDPDACTTCNPKCEHGNDPDACTTCNPKCEHGNDPAACTTCNPQCEHGNDPDACTTCNPKCEHGSDPAACATCNPKCEHGSDPDACTTCNPKCEHGNDPDTCATCHPEESQAATTETTEDVTAAAQQDYRIQFLSNVDDNIDADMAVINYYVVLKITEGNTALGNTTLWQGVYVSGRYDDFHIRFFTPTIMDYTLPEEEPEGPGIDFGSGYTAAQIAQMRADQEKKIKEIDFEIKLANAEYKIMLKEVSDGKVYAEIDGKVVSLLPEEEAKMTQQPVLKVSGGGGFFIQGTVSELEKDNLVIGQEVTVNDWNTGMMYTGEVRSVGDFPASNGYWNGMGNPNTTYYPFTVFVGEEADLQAGRYVNIQYSTSASTAGIYLDNAFIRTEQGRSYVYARGADGRLEKRLVTIGKSLWGSYKEILSGLTVEDYIAFPYGKHVKEGAPTVESDLSELYGY